MEESIGMILRRLLNSVMVFYRMYTYMATKTLRGLQALVRPGDVFLTDYKYLGFLDNGYQRYTKYVRTGFFGIQIEGKIDLETGRELS